MSRLLNKVALITGASAGIGAETARRFAAEGAKVVVAGFREGEADNTVAQIVTAGGNAVSASGDLTREADIQALVETAIRAYGRIDILHSNAALTDPVALAQDGDVVSVTPELWDRTFAINLRAPALLCRHVIPHMLRTGGGSIIMTGSGKGVQGDIMNTAYGATKAGLINLAKNVAAQYGKQGIRSNILVVGLVMTEALDKGVPLPLQEVFKSHHLTPFLGTPRHVADAALFLASEESAFVTGQELYVDGGFTSHSPVLADLQRFMSQQPQ
ncbi:MAG: SDR family NAD(P)-dependent oxidoreductase [Janthinobacterium lividum]